MCGTIIQTLYPIKSPPAEFRYSIAERDAAPRTPSLLSSRNDRKAHKTLVCILIFFFFFVLGSDIHTKESGTSGVEDGDDGPLMEMRRVSK